MTNKPGNFLCETANSCQDAYFAGYFDGEGCVGFHKRYADVIPRIRISVQSANLPSVEALQARYGGTVTVVGPPKHSRKSQYHWRIGSIHDCLAFIAAIEPYSIEKRVQLTLAREWLQHRLAVPRRCRSAAGTAQLLTETRTRIRAQKELDFFVFSIRPNEGDNYNEKSF